MRKQVRIASSLVGSRTETKVAVVSQSSRPKSYNYLKQLDDDDDTDEGRDGWKVSGDVEIN